MVDYGEMISGGEHLPLYEQMLGFNAFGYSEVASVEVGGEITPVALRGRGVKSIVLGDYVITEDGSSGNDIAGTVVGFDSEADSDLLVKV